MESASILNGEQPEAVLDSEIALNDPGSVARAHPSAAQSLTILTRFISASASTRWRRQRGTYQFVDEVNSELDENE